jgi:signal transduction histidine kinase
MSAPGDRAEAILLAQREVLERCAQGEPLEAILDRVTTAIREHSVDGAIPSILLVESGVLRHGSAPDLPAVYTAAIDGVSIGPAAGSCGTAAYRGQPVYATDIQTDPLWEDWRHLALPHNLRACWSQPIVGSNGQVLGTFALYYREPRRPSPDDVGLIELFSRTTAILIEWKRNQHAQQQLLAAEQRARQAAENANRGKDEFVATLSHELRTPLNAIVGWARMLRMPNLNAALTERAISAIERNAQAQTRLVEDLLDISRIMSGKVDLDVALLDVNALLEAALDAVRPLAAGKGIQLVAIPAPPGASVQGDANRLRQVLWNLLTNAVKFTPAGGDVRVAARSEPGGTRLSVSDTGIGIPADLLPHVFDRYRQADDSSGGLGLGLAIAKHVVELHGGTLEASSDGPGRGARFDVILPLAVATAAAQSGSAGTI